ncbi:FAD-dependent monooxygenase [Macrococcus sp. DPC7161]|uniref:FAD-dependent monooxygenase n=1 Tax=Macrococcus sp. DPC7161 TaxID=2507060 RepID=UPI00100B06D9|nr:FAD-dependent monooxygenase [Macrococcus sp. DPC7161]RXK17830.1 hypothetical protein ER639_08555 [Macrococcus sp. DPC7161]
MKVGIIGAGFSGMTAAILLEQLGIDVKIFEKRHTLTQLSVKIGFNQNVFKIFETIGIAQEVQAQSSSAPALNIYTSENKQLKHIPYASTEFEQGFIDRDVLFQLLKSKLQSDIQLIHEVVKVDENSGTIYFSDGTHETFDVVIASDGGFSKVRQQFFGIEPTFRGYTCFRGIVNDIDMTTDVHEYWGKKGRIQLVKVQDDVYWSAYINAYEQDKNYKQYTKYSLQKHFVHYPPLVQQVFEQTSEYFTQQDIYDSKPLDAFTKGKVALIGDAAHMLTPNLGQGTAFAIEDAVCLVQQLMKYDDVESALKAYDKLSVSYMKKVTLNARRIGNLAQLDANRQIAIRNKMMKTLPSRFVEKWSFSLNHRFIN